MTFRECPIAGAFEIVGDEAADERGTVATTFSAEAFADAGLVPPVAQSVVAFNLQAGTLRGLHVQDAPHAQAKLVRCTSGALLDVLLDVRRSSPTFRAWYAVELMPRSGFVVYVPEGVAHGYQTLVPETEVSYQLSRGRVASAERGIRHDDPAFGIEWPLPVTAISDRDRGWPDWEPA